MAERCRNHLVGRLSLREMVMEAECSCGAEIEAWQDECRDCELADVMGASEDRRWTSRGNGRGAAPALRTALKDKWGHKHQFYALRWRERGLVKFGVTANLRDRIKRIEAQAGEPLELMGACHISHVLAETGFHAMMNGSAEKFSGEWYYWTPRIEALVDKLKMAPRAA